MTSRILKIWNSFLNWTNFRFSLYKIFVVNCGMYLIYKSEYLKQIDFKFVFFFIRHEINLNVIRRDAFLSIDNCYSKINLIHFIMRKYVFHSVWFRRILLLYRSPWNPRSSDQKQLKCSYTYITLYFYDTFLCIFHILKVLL